MHCMATRSDMDSEFLMKRPIAFYAKAKSVQVCIYPIHQPMFTVISYSLRMSLINEMGEKS